MNKKRIKDILDSFDGTEDDLYDEINYINMKSNKFNVSDRNELVFRTMYLYHKERGLENIRKDLNLPIVIPNDIDYEQFLKYLEELKQHKASLELRPDVKNFYDLIMISSKYRLLNMTDPSWTKIYSSKLKGNEIKEIGKMYISVDNKDLYRFATLLLDKSLYYGLEDFEFKVNNDEGTTRRDNVVIYFTEENMGKYISLVNQIIAENPNIQLNEQNPLGYSIGKNICVGKDYKNGSESYTSKVCKTIVALKNIGINTTTIVDEVDNALGEHLKPVINLLEQEKLEHTTSEKAKITPLEINNATEATLINKPGLLGNLVTKVKGILGVKKEKNERYK